MLKLVNLSLVLFLTAIVYAGSDNVKVTWGPEHKAISRQQPVAFLGNTKTGFIQVSNERGRLLTIQSFSPALELKSVTLVDSKILPKGYELVDCLNWGSKYYLFYSTWNRKEATERLFVKEISLEQGTLVGTAKELLACEKIAGDFQINSMVSFVTNNKFKLQFGPDSSTLGVFVQYRRAVESNGKKENNLYGFWKFDKDFNTLWKQTLVTMPLHFSRFPKGIYQNDKDANFQFLKSVRTNDSIKNTIENSINSHKEIVKFGAKFQEPVFVTLPLYDKRISQSYLNLDVNGYPVCTGYYIKPGLDWTPAIDEINTDGAFMQRLTGWGDTIEDVRTNVYKFKDEMLTSIKSKTGQGIPEKNKTKEEQAKRSVDIKNTII